MPVIGRAALERILYASKRERFEFKRSQRTVFETDRALKVLARLLSLLLIVVGFAVRDVYDVDKGVLTVTQYSWWGMKKDMHAFPSIADIGISVRISRAARGPDFMCLVVKDKKSGKVVFRSFRTAWHGYRDYNKKLATIMQTGGRYRDGVFAWLVNCLMWALGIFFVTLMPAKWLCRP